MLVIDTIPGWTDLDLDMVSRGGYSLQSSTLWEKDKAMLVKSAGKRSHTQQHKVTIGLNFML